MPHTSSDKQSPLVVLENGSVIDASPESGVKLGLSARHARQVCRAALHLPYNPEDYRKRSFDLGELYLKLTPGVELVRKHQAFLDLSGPDHPLPRITQLAYSLVPQFGYGLKLGLAPNRLVARALVLAAEAGLLPRRSHPQLPSGVALWIALPGEEERLLAQLPIDCLWLSGDELVNKLRWLGLCRIGQLAQIGEGELYRRFGSAGALLYAHSRGRDDSPLQVNFPPPEERVRVNFGGEVESRLALERALADLAGELNQRLRQRRLGYQKLTLTITQDDGGAVSVSRVLPRAENNPELCRHTLLVLMERARIARPVSGLAVTAAQLRPVLGRQLRLFAGPTEARERQSGLEKTIETLGRKYRATVVATGRDLAPSRREILLGFYDPMRSDFRPPRKDG